MTEHKKQSAPAAPPPVEEVIADEVTTPVVSDAAAAPADFEERVVSIDRCSKVVKGGRNFSFRALVVVGNRRGQVGVGVGKANEVSDAIRKGHEIARRSLINVPLAGFTVPHAIEAKFGSGKVLIRPASRGTGMIAGGAVRAVLELAGVSDVLAKSLGSENPINVARATMKAVGLLRTRDQVCNRRDLPALDLPAKG